MVGQHVSRIDAVAGIALLWTGFMVTSPIAPHTSPEPTTAAVELTAVATPDPGDFLGLGQFAAQMVEVNELVGRFVQYVPDVLNQQFTGLNDVVNSSLADLDWSDLGASMNALGANLDEWEQGFWAQMWQFAENMDTDPTTGELVPSLCNILNVLGNDLSNQFQVMVAGINDMGSELSAQFQNAMDGLDGFFDGLGGL
ncbi:hypothetical protein MTER_21770 [Mycolicibacter terrae]|uniref:Uncharacterized protein n=1 Tax=Mycolicibacter terrae TaxID=1788 RepID=A0AAD1MHI0_9MYCO|nr:hypothetical protein [Mycolicibacter terrae]BBX22766.1 hypothetical protein MTER_21770 [Mycolicibacter terrae]SNV71825.1 Uncharacterised protein [Mycolicibacter terrae]